MQPAARAALGAFAAAALAGGCTGCDFFRSGRARGGPPPHPSAVPEIPGDPVPDRGPDAHSSPSADPSCDGGECRTDAGCGAGESCVAGRCEPVTWPRGRGCKAFASGCVDHAFPDPCYERTTRSDACPARDSPLYPPRCVSFLELGAEGPEDDAVVLRRLHDLWRLGQSRRPAPRSRVVLAVGDSISESMTYVSAPALDCLLPDFRFESGYRLVGQPGILDAPQTAMSGERADWGLAVIGRGEWWTAVRPEVATVSFGTNELWGNNDSLDTYARNLRGIVDGLMDRGVIPILVTPPPGTFEVMRQRQVCGRWMERTPRPYGVFDFVGVMRQVAAERSLPVVDVYARFTAFDRPQGSAEARRRLGICRADGRCDGTLWWRTLLGDGVHPCGGEDCPAEVDVTGSDLRNDSVLRMYKYLERNAMTRCEGTAAPPEPAGYRWDSSHPVASMRAARDRSYCPDPVFR